jgi:hypothetical protein
MTDISTEKREELSQFFAKVPVQERVKSLLSRFGEILGYDNRNCSGTIFVIKTKDLIHTENIEGLAFSYYSSFYSELTDTLKKKIEECKQSDHILIFRLEYFWSWYRRFGLAFDNIIRSSLVLPDETLSKMRVSKPPRSDGSFGYKPKYAHCFYDLDKMFLFTDEGNQRLIVRWFQWIEASIELVLKKSEEIAKSKLCKHCGKEYK